MAQVWFIQAIEAISRLIDLAPIWRPPKKEYALKLGFFEFLCGDIVGTNNIKISKDSTTGKFPIRKQHITRNKPMHTEQMSLWGSIAQGSLSRSHQPRFICQESSSRQNGTMEQKIEKNVTIDKEINQKSVHHKLIDMHRGHTSAAVWWCAMTRWPSSCGSKTTDP